MSETLYKGEKYESFVLGFILKDIQKTFRVSAEDARFYFFNALAKNVVTAEISAMIEFMKKEVESEVCQIELI